MVEVDGFEPTTSSLPVRFWRNTGYIRVYQNIA